MATKDSKQSAKTVEQIDRLTGEIVMVQAAGPVGYAVGPGEVENIIDSGTAVQRVIVMQREFGGIAKSLRNSQQNWNFRGIDQVYARIQPLLSKYGLTMSAEVLEKTREERTTPKGGILAFTCLRMRYRFWAPDGSSHATEAEGEGMDSGDKSSNKAMAVAHKYAILQALCVSTEETAKDDPDHESPEAAPRSAKEKDTPKPPNHVTLAKSIISAHAKATTVDLFDAESEACADSIKSVSEASESTGTYLSNKLKTMRAKLEAEDPNAGSDSQS